MDARARMEARRKRILLNAEARMNKIMGRPYEMKETSDEANTSGTRNVSNGFLNGAATVYEENEIPSASVNVRLIDSVPHNTELVETKTVLSFVNYIFFICLGIVTRLSYLFDLSWMFNENLLFPFLIVGIPWAILNSVNNPQVSSVLPSLLLFTGLQQGENLPSQYSLILIMSYHKFGLGFVSIRKKQNSILVAEPQANERVPRWRIGEAPHEYEGQLRIRLRLISSPGPRGFASLS